MSKLNMESQKINPLCQSCGMSTLNGTIVCDSCY